MKAHLLKRILICLLVSFLIGCQADQIPDEVCPIDETSGEYDESCAPPGINMETEAHAYSPEDNVIPVVETADPITTADLAPLFKEWHLTSYAENGIKSDPPFKYLTLNADGSYTVATETELERGRWMAVSLGAGSSLVLDQGTGETIDYQILEVEDTILNLRTWHENTEIDEGYLPAESGCECD